MRDLDGVGLLPLIPIQTWKWRWLLVPNTFTRYSRTIQLFTPSVRVAAKMPGAALLSWSVQNGARTLFERAGSGICVRVAAIVVLA